MTSNPVNLVGVILADCLCGGDLSAGLPAGQSNSQRVHLRAQDSSS